jgi:hypothetical protein
MGRGSARERRVVEKEDRERGKYRKEGEGRKKRG